MRCRGGGGAVNDAVLDYSLYKFLEPDCVSQQKVCPLIFPFKILIEYKYFHVENSHQILKICI